MKRLLCVSAILVFATTAHAATIDFDAHASTGAISGAPGAAAVVTDDYAALGVVFGQTGVSAGSAVVNNSNTFSLPNGACGLDAAGNIVANCAGDQYFHFVNPADGITPASTTSLSFVVGDGGGDLDQWILHIYDSNDVELEARVVASIANTLQSFAYSDIARVWIEWTAPHIAGYLLDNLEFAAPTATAVPEPGTLALVALGGVLARRARRNRNV